MPKLPKTTQKPTQPILLTTLRNTRPRKMANRKIHHTNKRTNRNQRRKCYAVSEKRLKRNGGFHPPNPLTAERGGANFWFMPQRTAPLFSTTDDRYGLEKSTLAIKKGRMGVWGLAPIIKLTPSAHRLLKKGCGALWQAPKNRGAAFRARGVWGAKRPHLPL